MSNKDLEVIHVSAEDRLRAENLHLKVINLNHEEQLLLQQLTGKQQERAAIQQQLGALKEEIEKKYSVNLTTHEIRETDGQVQLRVPPALSSMEMTGSKERA